MNKKGIVLVLVLSVILVAVIISMVIVSAMLSQTRLTKHQIDRVKAKYAAQGGVNYALEMLRTGRWHYNSVHYICNSSTDSSCTNPTLNNTVDLEFPFKVNITIGSATGCSGFACINATIDYTYTAQ